MAFPRTRNRVPRERVGQIVDLMLGNNEVGDVECTEDSQGTYTIRPRRR